MMPTHALCLACWLTYLRLGAAGAVVAILARPWRHAYLAAAGLCALAGATDVLDGRIARRRSTTSSYGAVLDLVADKVLAVGTVAALVRHRVLPVWVLVVLGGREMAVLALRVARARQGAFISPDLLGKTKTALMGVALVGLLLHKDFRQGGILTRLAPGPIVGGVLALSWWAFLVSLSLAVVSGLHYIAAEGQWLRTRG